MAVKFPIVWERMDRLSIERLKVFGGWLVKSNASASQLVFVPDAKHEWELEERSPREDRRREA